MVQHFLCGLATVNKMMMHYLVEDCSLLFITVHYCSLLHYLRAHAVFDVSLVRFVHLVNRGFKICFQSISEIAIRLKTASNCLPFQKCVVSFNRFNDNQSIYSFGPRNVFFCDYIDRLAVLSSEHSH